jgi:molybdate transport system ATP-binding protein
VAIQMTAGNGQLGILAETLTNSVTASATPAALSVEARKTLDSGFVLDVRFAVPPGITILFGASGAGKTTVLNCVAGLTPPDTGCIAVAGQVLFDSTQGVNLPVVRRRVGYVFQHLALFPHLTVGGNVEYGISHVRLPERRVRSQRLLESFRIAHLRDRRPGAISGGERQRVALARALVTDPGVLLLDEPLAGLDAATRSRLLDDLRAWNTSHRIPVLYVTHSREEVFALGERVLVLQEGKVLAQGSPYAVLQSPTHEAIAELAGVENRFDGVVTALHEPQGTMTCRLSEPEGKGVVHLEIPLARVEVGTPVRVGLRAGDILLATAAPQGLSARNVLPGRVCGISRRDVTLVADVDCGVRFEVHLTPGAAQELHLQPGREVWLVIKTYSCHLLRKEL